jgi:Kef-type K+ transport system membrane component KefB
MEGIAVLLLAAAAAYGVAHALRIPAIPVLLLTGVALALSGVLPLALLEDTLILGTTILVFATGVELTPNRTRAQRQTATRVGGLQFVLLGLAGLATALLLGYALVPAAYIALALTASSTLVVVRLLQQRRQLFEPFGRMVLGVLLLQDLLVLLLIPVVTEMPHGAARLALGVAATVFLATLAYIVFRFGTALLQRLDEEDELMLLALLAVLFVFIGLAEALRLPLVTGALLAGIALSRYPVSAMVRTRLASITEFFSALFFIALGALIGIPAAAELGHAFVLAFVVVFVTPPLVTMIAERAGMSSRAAIESGLLLAQTSEISLVIGLYGLFANQISQSAFTVIALMTVMTMIVTPFISADRVAWWLMRRRPTWQHPLRRRSDQRVPFRDHVLILGSGATGMPLLETLLATGVDVLVIDDDPVVVARLRDAEVPCLRGDASDVELLRRAGADRARIITSTIRRPEDNRRLLEVARGVPALIRVFDEHDAEWIRELGGTPILASHAAADELLKWYDLTFPRPPSHGSADTEPQDRIAGHADDQPRTNRV